MVTEEQHVGARPRAVKRARRAGVLLDPNLRCGYEPTTLDEYFHQQEMQQSLKTGPAAQAAPSGQTLVPSGNEPRADMTFSTFVVGRTNEFAYNASL
jgi:chromosomal replication initiation ATPase DnaA